MTYDEFFSAILNSNPGQWFYDDDLGKYVFEGDVRITIAADRTDAPPAWFSDGLTERFADRNAYNRRMYLCFNGVAIKILYTMVVDGGRMIIPYPDRGPDGETVTISQEQYRLGRILGIGFWGYDFDEYLRKGRITVKN